MFPSYLPTRRKWWDAERRRIEPHPLSHAHVAGGAGLDQGCGCVPGNTKPANEPGVHIEAPAAAHARARDASFR